MNIKQHGAGGIGIVRHVHPALRQIVNQPGVHGAEKKLSLCGSLSRTFYIL